MSKPVSDEKWRITGEPLEIRSAIRPVYEELVEKEKLFPNNYSLFCLGLVYGLLHNKTHDVTPNASFIKLFAISDPVSQSVIDLVYRLMDGDDQSGDKNKIWQKMLSIADGGVLALSDTYKSNGNLRIPYLLKEAEELWPDRAKGLSNINN